MLLLLGSGSWTNVTIQHVHRVSRTYCYDAQFSAIIDGILPAKRWVTRNVECEFIAPLYILFSAMSPLNDSSTLASLLKKKQLIDLCSFLAMERSENAARGTHTYIDPQTQSTLRRDTSGKRNQRLTDLGVNNEYDRQPAEHVR